jgi:predicted KAP-like P-loop ATPase
MSITNDTAVSDISKLANSKYKDDIVEFIKECKTPFSIALSGKWGSGKTSMMKAMEKDLEEKYLTIWFNPWENEKHSEPMVSLLQIIMKKISLLSKAKESVKKISEVVTKSSLSIFKNIIDLSTIQENGEKYEYDNFSYIHRQEKFNEMFKEAVMLALCGHGEKCEDLKPVDSAKMIIFIDDLDRCEDSTVIKLLNAIKLHLSTKYCIFVFGFDRFHIEKSLSRTIDKTPKEAKTYLEKLFQNTFYLKPPKDEQIKEFIEDNLNEDILSKDIEYISEFMSHNPREIKHFIRAFNFEYNRLEAKKLKIRGIALIVYLKIFYENVYALLVNQPYTLSDLLRVFKEKDIKKPNNQREEYFYLEMHSFINKVNDEEKEKDSNNLLTNIYSMQGKHKQFEDYTEKFGQFFEKSNEIEDYL